MYYDSKFQKAQEAYGHVIPLLMRTPQQAPSHRIMPQPPVADEA